MLSDSFSSPEAQILTSGLEGRIPPYLQSWYAASYYCGRSEGCYPLFAGEENRKLYCYLKLRQGHRLRAQCHTTAQG